MAKPISELFQMALQSFGIEEPQVRSLMKASGHERYDSKNWQVYIDLLANYKQRQLAEQMWPEKCPECGAPIALDPEKCRPSFRLQWRWKCTVGGNACYWKARAAGYLKNVRDTYSRFEQAIEKGVESDTAIRTDGA